MRVPLTLQVDRYILRQLLIALAATTAGLAALIWLTQSLRFVELVVNRGLSLAVFLHLTGLLVPGFVAIVLPITTFVVVQFVYLRLSGDRELTVMRSMGLSSLALARPALILALLTVGTGYALTLVVVPASYGAFRAYQFDIRNRIAVFLLQEGVFTPVSNELTVYVRSREQDGTLRGILVEDARQENSRATVLAERGQLVAGPRGPRVLLQNGSRQEIDRRTGRLNVLTFAENTIELSQARRDEEQRFRDATEMSLTELLDPDPAYVFARDVGKLRVEAHRRLSQPLTGLSFALIGLASALTGSFRRHGNLLRPVVAVGIVVGLLVGSLAVANLAARRTELIPLIWAVAVLPGVAAAWLLVASQVQAPFGPRRARGRLGAA